MQMRDALGPLYHDDAFAHLFPQIGRPVEAPWRLALITVMQFAEELPDRAAADAVRGRIDWKYALVRRGRVVISLAQPGVQR
jgi:transposase